MDAARTYLVANLSSLWERVQQGHRPTLSDRGELWLATANAAQTAVDVIEPLYAAAGASAVYASCDLDRCLRDARTAAQHIVAQESSYELAGKQLFGRSILPSPWVIDYRGEEESGELRAV